MNLTESTHHIEDIALQLSGIEHAADTLGLATLADELSELVLALRQEAVNIRNWERSQSTQAYNDALKNAGGFLTRLAEKNQ
jgi:DNA-binding FrmR family transcriptional regulator